MYKIFIIFMILDFSFISRLITGFLNFCVGVRSRKKSGEFSLTYVSELLGRRLGRVLIRSVLEQYNCVKTTCINSL